MVLPVVLSSVTKKSYLNKIVAMNPIAYWPLNETTGTAAVNYGSLGTAANGTYTNAVLGQTAAPGGGLAPYFDGTGDYVDIYSVALNGGWNGNLGSLAGWFKVSAAADWTDGATHVVCQIGTDATHYLGINKAVANNTLQQYRVYAAETKNATTTAAGGSTVWNFAVLTWSDSANELKGHLNGAQISTTQTPVATWVGALGATTCNISGPATTAWKGYLAHVALWTRVLTLPEIANLYAWGI